MKSTFRILFLARWELKKKNGKVPLCARITIDGERVKFSLKSEVTAKIWDPKSGILPRIVSSRLEKSSIKSLCR